MSEPEDLIPEKIPEESGASTKTVPVTEVPEVEAEVPEPTEQETGYQKRINKITADKYREIARANALQQELDDVKAKAQNAAGVAPRLEDFDYDDEKFLAARIEHQVGIATAKVLDDRRVSTAQVARDEVTRAYNARVTKAAIPDFGEVIGKLPQLPVGVVEAIQLDENGPKLAYFLGNNRDIADSLVERSPIAAALELGKISAGLSGKKIKKPSGAPTPVRPIGGNAKGSVKNPEDMSMEEIFNS